MSDLNQRDRAILDDFSRSARVSGYLIRETVSHAGLTRYALDSEDRVVAAVCICSPSGDGDRVAEAIDADEARDWYDADGPGWVHLDFRARTQTVEPN